MASKKKQPSLGIFEFLRTLKPSVTYPALRQMVRIPQLPIGIEIQLAKTKEDLEAAYSLLHDVYVEIGFMEPHPSGMRLNVYNMLPHTSTVVAKINGEVVGTISIVRDNPLGLPLDESVDTQSYRKPGWQVAEVTGLAVARPWRGQGQILFPLLKFTYEYAVGYLGVEAFQVATALKKEDFFRALLFFEPITEQVFDDPMINGTSVRALFLNLNEAKTQFKRAFNHRGPEGNLYSYFADLELPNFKFPDRRWHQAFDPTLTESTFAYFFAQKTNLIERLSDREIHALRDIYRDSPVVDLLPDAHSLPPYPPRRSDQRFVVSCPALLEGEQGDEPVTLVDVSHSGFRMYTKMPLRLAGPCHFRIQIGDSQTLPVVAEPIWNQRRREWGFQFVETPKGWKEFLNHLKRQLAGAESLKKTG